MWTTGGFSKTTLALALVLGGCQQLPTGGGAQLQVSGQVGIGGEDLCGDAPPPPCFLYGYRGPLGCLLQPLPDGTPCDGGVCRDGLCAGAPGGSTLVCPPDETVALLGDGTSPELDLVGARGGPVVVRGDLVVVPGVLLVQTSFPSLSVDRPGVYTFRVTAVDASGVALGACETAVTFVDDTPPAVSLVLDVPPDGLPEFVAPAVLSFTVADASGDPATLEVGWLVDGSPASGTLPGEWLPAGLHCVQAFAVDASGNRGVSSPTCFVSRDTVQHELDVHVGELDCDETSVSGRFVLTPKINSFSPRDVAPSSILLTLKDASGFVVASQPVSVVGASSPDELVSGAVANDRALEVTFASDSSLQLYACPSLVTVSLMAVSRGWLLSASGHLYVYGGYDPAASVGLDPADGPPVALSRTVGLTEPKQPPHHPRNVLPPEPAPASTGPLPTCRCEHLREFHFTDFRDSDGDAGTDLDGDELRLHSVAAMLSGDAVAVGGSLSASGSSAFQVVGTTACMPRPCPTCCAQPSWQCSAQSEIEVGAASNAPGSAVAAGALTVGGCVTLESSAAARAKRSEAELNLGAVSVSSTGVSTASSLVVTVSGTDFLQDERRVQASAQGSTQGCMAFAVAVGSTQALLSANPSDGDPFARSSVEVSISRRVALEASCSGSAAQ